MFSARCAEMGESGFAPTRRMTNRFWGYMWEMYKTHFLDPVVVGALPETTVLFDYQYINQKHAICGVMFSARCAEMGESGFAPTRRMTNRFWVYM